MIGETELAWSMTVQYPKPKGGHLLHSNNGVATARPDQCVHDVFIDVLDYMLNREVVLKDLGRKPDPSTVIVLHWWVADNTPFGGQR